MLGRLGGKDRVELGPAVCLDASINAGHEPRKAWQCARSDVPVSPKYERGTNRIGASRLQHISEILQVPVAFFFEGAPTLHQQRGILQNAPSAAYLTDFLATSDGLALTKAFMRIKKPTLRRSIVTLVKQIAETDD
jgi:hypothetical protein